MCCVPHPPRFLARPALGVSSLLIADRGHKERGEALQVTLHSTQRPAVLSQFSQGMGSLLGHPTVPDSRWGCPCSHSSLPRQ